MYSTLFYIVQQFSERTAAYCQGQYYHILVIRTAAYSHGQYYHVLVIRTAAYSHGQYYHILVNPIAHDDPRQIISAALSLVGKRPGREADYSLPSSADDWMYIHIFSPWFSWFEKCKLDL